MNLKQIEYFLHLARFEHVSQTADFLNVSQPTLSKSLSAIEQELGVELFDRIGNGIKLNENGTRFRDYAEKALEYLNSGIISVKQTKYEISGSISISCWSYASILLPCINEYTALNPYVNINIMQYTHDSSNPSDPSFDFMLTSANAAVDAIKESNEQFWVSQTLFREKMFLVIAPRHPLYEEACSQGDDIDVDMFKESRFVGMKRNDTIFTGMMTHPSQKFGFVPKTYFQTDDFVVRCHALEAGIGVALLPEACIEDAKKLCPGLCAFEIKGAQKERDIIFMRKKKNLLSESAIDFWDFVLEYYGLPKDERK